MLYDSIIPNYIQIFMQMPRVPTHSDIMRLCTETVVDDSCSCSRVDFCTVLACSDMHSARRFTYSHDYYEGSCMRVVVVAMPVMVFCKACTCPFI